MKSINLWSYTVILIALFIISCRKDSPQELIVGKWKLSEFEPNPEFRPTEEVLEQMLATGKTEYTADNRYILEANGMKQTGKYNLSEDGKLIQYTRDGTTVLFVDTIIVLNKKKLSFRDQHKNQITSTRE